MPELKFTATETRILQVLKDGKPHLRKELLDVSPNGRMTLKTLQFHLVAIRKKIRPRECDIICQLLHRKPHYRAIRLLKPIVEEKPKPIVSFDGLLDAPGGSPLSNP